MYAFMHTAVIAVIHKVNFLITYTHSN